MRKSPGITRAAAAHGPLVFLSDFLLLFLLLFGTLWCVITSFSLLEAGLFLPACGILALLVCVTCSLGRVWFVALAVLLSGLAAVFSHLWDTVLLGGNMACAYISTALARQFDTITPAAFPPDGSPRALNLFILLAAALLAILLGLSLVRRRGGLFAFCVTFSLILPALAAELWPYWPTFLVVLTCWLVLALRALSRRAVAETARLTLLALPAAAALLALLSLALPQENYVQPPWSLKAYGRLVDAGERLSRGYGETGLTGLLPGLTAGSSESVDLAGAGPRSYSGKTMLEVRAQKEGRLYLRGCSSSVYTGRGWEPLSREAYGTLPAFLALQGDGQPLYFPARTQASPGTDSVWVRNLRAPGRYVYAPYALSPAAVPPDAEFDRDVGLLADPGVRAHTLTFCGEALRADSFVPLTGAAQRGELAYRAFVYRNYLGVPEDFLERLSPWRERAYQAREHTTVRLGDIPPQFQTPISTAYGWAALLAATTNYDLNAPVTPENRDFTEYFLNESGVGYCMHYATAATLLMRACGVPSRYVSGFAAEVKPGTTQVPDSAAHAWMEIYLDGYGWYPVEVTPAAGAEPTTQTPPLQPEPTQPEPPAPKPKPPKPAVPAGETSKKPLPLLLWAVLFLACGAVILIARRSLAQALRGRHRNPKNPNRAVIAAYVHLEKLQPWGADIPDWLTQLAAKAKFSRHILTAEECAAVLTYLHAETARLRAALPAPKRLALRWLWALD